MNKQHKFSWMVKPRGFIKLLGGEYELMQKAGGTVLFKFYLSAIAVVAIAGISFLSLLYAVELLFHKVIVEILLSLFLSSLFVLLFIFIVNTFTKDVRQRSLLNFSNVTRLVFVMFIGFIISKPIEVFFYRNVIEPHVEHHKTTLIKGHIDKIHQLFEDDLNKLFNSKRKYESINTSGDFNTDISQINEQIDILGQKKANLAAASVFRIEHGAYFIYRIKVISGNYAGSWLISLVVMALFLLPVFLIYSISADEEYFKRKHAQERKMVEKTYQAFTQKYSEIFLDRYGLQVDLYSKYEDPPFNTLLKKSPVCRSADDFHERFA